ncbi:MAG: TRAP transporter small permease [Gemmobacter sp.]|nr:TRAP transporter small permease [Gemmobacter sp.]
MTLLFDLSGKLAWALASFAKLLIGIMILLVVSDVAVRNFGWRPMTWAISASEYILMYVAFLAMPWLVRIKGHVFVEFLRFMLPEKAKQVLAKVVYLTSVLLCLYLGWIALSSLMLSIERGTYETRTFDTPKWVVFLPIMTGFFLSAVEWLRYLLGHDSLYNRDPLEVEGM